MTIDVRKTTSTFQVQLKKPHGIPGGVSTCRVLIPVQAAGKCSAIEEVLANTGSTSVAKTASLRVLIAPTGRHREQG